MIRRGAIAGAVTGCVLGVAAISAYVVLMVMALEPTFSTGDVVSGIFEIALVGIASGLVGGIFGGTVGWIAYLLGAR
ncbi:hypothetical protein ACERK3_02335 [Phycisphaerales bacterium AB-hyl4]|uniref:Major facilitator superfamily (MFS) profile domain-containing protein n=1 Tax=Natronomicrosphaera hydrolytica TaxID=3242702 RepID=A0ABV4U0J2_9BACT